MSEQSQRREKRREEKEEEERGRGGQTDETRKMATSENRMIGSRTQ